MGSATTSSTPSVEDDDGDLWVATPTGVMRMARDGFSGYTASEGLGSDHIVHIGETARKAVYAVGINWSISIFDGTQFRSSRLALPTGSSLMWASQAGYHDRAGRWWALTHQGLYRFASTIAGKATARPTASTPRATAFRTPRCSASTRTVPGPSGWAPGPGDPLDDGLARLDAALTK